MRVLHYPPETTFSRSVAHFLERMTYKPNWREASVVSIAESPRTVMIRFYHEEPNADDWRDEHPKVGAICTAFTFRDTFADGAEFERVFPEMLLRQLWASERHEIDEWFRVSGARVHEAHPELAPKFDFSVSNVDANAKIDIGVRGSLGLVPDKRNLEFLLRTVGA